MLNGIPAFAGMTARLRGDDAELGPRLRGDDFFSAFLGAEHFGKPSFPRKNVTPECFSRGREPMIVRRITGSPPSRG